MRDPASGSKRRPSVLEALGRKPVVF